MFVTWNNRPVLKCDESFMTFFPLFIFYTLSDIDKKNFFKCNFDKKKNTFNVLPKIELAKAK